MIDVFTATRPAGDILSRVVRVQLDGKSYELPVRSIKANREWKTNLNDRLAAMIGGLEASGDDYAALFGLIANQIDDLVDMLVSYDTSGILPSRDAILDIEPDASLDVLNAVREVWRAANPLVATTLAAIGTPIPESDVSSPLTSSPPVNITGRRRKSKTA